MNVHSTSDIGKHPSRYDQETQFSSKLPVLGALVHSEASLLSKRWIRHGFYDQKY